MAFLNEIKNHLTRKYGLLADSRIKRILCMGTPIFILLFLLVFQPFTTNLATNIPKIISGTFLISITSSILWIAHLYGIFHKSGYATKPW